MDLRPPATVLQFAATLVTRNQNDKQREFVIAYYVEDRAFAIFERSIPNSGFRGGKFLQKTVVNNPKTNQPYQPSDIYIGATLEIAGRTFCLQEASEDALKIMEAQSDIFVKCDLAELMKKIRQNLKIAVTELLVQLQKKDIKRRNYVTLRDLQDVFLQNGITFGDQEFLTLFRRYQINDDDYFDYPEFIRNLV